MFSMHCWTAVVMGVVLGMMYHKLPCTRDGIDAREDLFHVIVRNDDGR